MKGSRALEELLISYIAEELPAEDKALAEQYINTDEEIRKQYEQLRNTWKLLSVNRQLNKIDVDGEWKRFEQAVAGKEQRLTVVKNLELPGDEQVAEKKTGRQLSAQVIGFFCNSRIRTGFADTWMDVYRWQ